MNILIVGGSGGIGSALIERFLAADADTTIFATYRTNRPKLNNPRVNWHVADVTTESDIESLANIVPKLDVLINAVGILHTDDQKPEKTVRKFESDFFQKNISSNTLPTLLLAKHFERHLKGQHRAFFVSVSARIGSIEDNRIGGWISYRCSKAALNMAIKTLSIEWQHKLPNCCVFSFHPGTTDTPLSKPFQKNVPPGKLFSPAFVAQSLLDLLNTKTPQDTGKFFSYDGTEIPW